MRLMPFADKCWKRRQKRICSLLGNNEVQVAPVGVTLHLTIALVSYSYTNIFLYSVSSYTIANLCVCSILKLKEEYITRIKLKATNKLPFSTTRRQFTTQGQGIEKKWQTRTLRLVSADCSAWNCLPCSSISPYLSSCVLSRSRFRS